MEKEGGKSWYYMATKEKGKAEHMSRTSCEKLEESGEDAKWLHVGWGEKNWAQLALGESSNSSSEKAAVDDLETLMKKVQHSHDAIASLQRECSKTAQKLTASNARQKVPSSMVPALIKDGLNVIRQLQKPHLELAEVLVTEKELVDVPAVKDVFH